MKTQHATFILQMIKHGDKLKAYQAAYPKAKGQSAIKAAERLLRQPEIAADIQQTMRSIRSKTIIETYKVMKQEQEVRILSVMQKRQILYQIATCEMKVGRWIKDDGGYRMVYEDPRPRDIIHAIDKDDKIEEACNRMRDVADLEFSHYDIYIDGRPAKDPTAPINPDIPLGIIMLPKKTQKEYELSPTGAVSASGVRDGEQQAEAGSLAQDSIPNHISDNTDSIPEEQNIVNSPFEGGEPQARGMSTREEQTLAQNPPNSDLLRLSVSAVKNFSLSPLVGRVDEVYSPSIFNEIEGLPDYLSQKKEYFAQKKQRTQNDPLSESFYKNFKHERDTAPLPHIYTDEEIETLKNDANDEQKETDQSGKKGIHSGKMYFPEKKYKDIL